MNIAISGAEGFIIAAGFGLLAGWVWGAKGGNPLFGFVVGLIFPFIGLLCILVFRPSSTFAPGKRRACPYCKEFMLREASTCPHCTKESQAWTFHEGYWWITDDTGARWWYDAPRRDWIRYEPSADEVTETR